jgi:3-phenylpropionate/trans-cinnamate dioxygenase ferredoxin reductase component
VVLADGDLVACDFAVAGVGIDPEVPAVAGAAMAQDNGILVDERCRTSAADIYGAGDVANHLHPVLGRIRVEHYHSAGHHGAAAARSMLGSAAPFDHIHNFWSDQYEHTLQYVGHTTSWDDFAVRGSLQDGKFVGFYLAAGVVRAAVGFDRGGDPEWEPDSEMAAYARLVAGRAQPDRGLLTDERADLGSLAR